MQTFLPYPNLYESVKCLDDKRLGKQRVEAMQMYNCLVEGSRWENHPAVVMWRGYEHILATYHNICIEEWVRRKKVNTMVMLPTTPLPNSKWKDYRRNPFPWWMGVDGFHASHASNLLRKDPVHYRDLRLISKLDNYLYLWPNPDPHEKSFRIVVPKWAKESGKYFIPPTVYKVIQ